MEVVTKENAAEFDKFVWDNPKGHFMQASAWAEVKNNWRWRGLIHRDADGNIDGTMALLIRKVPVLPFSLMYSPRGPVCCLKNGEVFKALVADARELGKSFHCYDLKLDTDVAVDDEEFRALVLDTGFVLKGNTQSFETVQPRFVFRLNVEGKTEEEVMASFHSKWRYNIRVAIKNGVDIQIKGAEAAEEFHNLMVVTGERDNFGIRSADYFERMVRALGENARIYMAYYQGKAIAGSLAIRHGDKVWYLYGASSNEHRNVMPNYLVQWSMIRWAVECGCRLYDFRGVSGFLDESNPLYGIYRFKKGFNGDFCEFIGEMDLVTNAPAFKLVEYAEKLRKTMRHK